MKKTIHLLLAALVMLTALPAVSAKDKNVYAKAPSAVRKRIKTAAKAIKTRQYQTAYDALGESDNDYIILKQTETLTDYFAQSLMHKAFALKDLAEGENLAELREADGDFDLIVYDPESVIESYAAEHGMTPPLHLALGHYYLETLLHYSGAWLRDDRELLQLSGEHFKTAIDGGCYNANYLCQYGEVLYYRGDLPGANEYFGKAVALDKKDGRIWYNYAVSFMDLEQYDDAAAAVKKAIKYEPVTEDNYQDYYFLLADAYYHIDNLAEGVKSLEEAKGKFPDDPFIYIKEGGLYVKGHDLVKAQEQFKTAYTMQPTESTLGFIMQYYLLEDDADAPIAFCRDLLPTQAGDDYNTGIIYSYLAQLEYIKGDLDATREALDNAEAHLSRTGVADTIKEQMDEVRLFFGLED